MTSIVKKNKAGAEDKGLVYLSFIEHLLYARFNAKYEKIKRKRRGRRMGLGRKTAASLSLSLSLESDGRLTLPSLITE